MSGSLVTSSWLSLLFLGVEGYPMYVLPRHWTLARGYLVRLVGLIWKTKMTRRLTESHLQAVQIKYHNDVMKPPSTRNASLLPFRERAGDVHLP